MLSSWDGKKVTRMEDMGGCNSSMDENRLSDGEEVSQGRRVGLNHRWVPTEDRQEERPAVKKVTSGYREL